MTVLIGSSLTGTEVQSTAIGEPIKAATVRVIMQDQAHAYERTTGLAADQAGTTASSINAVHKHNHSTSGEGTLLFRQFASMVYGTKGPNGEKDFATYTLTTYAGPFNITETSSTVDEDDLPCIPALIYVPSGWVDRDIVMVIDASSDPDMEVTIRNTSGTAVFGPVRVRQSGTTGSPLADVMVGLAGPGGNAWAAVFQVASSGVYWVDVRTTLRENGGTRVIYGWTITGVCRYTRGIVLDRNAWTPYRDGNNVQVGDPDASNAFQPIDDVWCPSGGDSPLHVGLIQKLTENAALIYEKATGLPAPGNETLTISTGHTHSGAAGEGPEIGVAHVACSFGGFAGVGSAYTEITGNRSRCPDVINTTTGIAGIGRTFMPRSANTSAGTSKLKCAVLVYGEGSKTGGACEINVDMSFGSTTKTFQSSFGSSDTFQVLTTPTSGSNAFAFTSGALNAWDVQWTRTSGSHNTALMQVCAVLWYTEE